MKRILIVFLFAPLFSLAQTSTKGFVMNGKLEGYANGIEVKLYMNGENTEMAKAKTQDGKFVLKGKVEDPVLCFLVVGSNKGVEMYVENTVMSVKGKQKEPGVIEVEGSSSHKDFTEFTKVFFPIAMEMNSTATTINNTMPGPERDKLMTNYTIAGEKLQQEIDKFVAKKSSSVVTPFVLNVTYQFKEDVIVLEKRYNLLDAAIKKTTAGKQLEQFIADNKIGAVGTQSLDFTQADTEGNPVSLSSFRGKYVLVDFWASWCGPCRQENPNVVENFNKFKEKNFTVLGVSLDRPGQKDKWLNAIREDNLTWTQVSDLQFWNNAAAKLYKIQGIPQNLLIDPNGKIIAKNLRGPDLQAKLCEILGCN